jgi:two-component system, NarL family, sensor kinase
VGHAVSGIALGYGTWAARRPVPGSSAALALWVGNWAWSVLAVMPAVFLLFPSGRLPTPRLRPVLGVALAVAPLYAVGIAIAPVRLSEVPPVNISFGVAAAGPLLDAGAEALIVLFLVLVLVSLGSMVWRIRGALGDERRQLAWGLLGAAVLTLQVPFEALAPANVAGMSSALFISGFCVSLGVAMVRHRLYEIDVILNRSWCTGRLPSACWPLTRPWWRC